MRKILSCLLVMALLAATVPMAILPAAAAGIPGDDDDNDQLTEDELVNNVLKYLQGEGDLELEELRDAAHVYAYWNGEPRTITDSANREVTIYKPIKRSVIFNGEAIETLASIKATDSIVGVNKYTAGDILQKDRFGDLPSVGSVWGPDYEALLSLEPDVVFLYASLSISSCDKIQDTLVNDYHITVIRLDCYLPESYVEEVQELGYLYEKEEEAEEFIDFYEGFMSTIEAEVGDIPEEEKPKVYFECYKDYQTAGEGSGWAQKLELAGGNNIFSDVEYYKDIDPEEMVKRNPEVIIRVPDYYAGGYDCDDITELSDVRDDIMDRGELANVTAVNNGSGSVYILANDFGGVRHFVGIGYIAQWLYPNKFPDLVLDPQAIHKQYLTEFQGLSGSLVDNGVFAYPEN
jgi:iron complex transport system substrate-binding protein